MAKKLRVNKKRVQRGKRMTKGKRYSIVAIKGRTRKFAATLIKTFNLGKRRLALFSVPKGS